MHLGEHFMDKEKKDNSKPFLKDPLWLSPGSWEITKMWRTKRPEMENQKKPMARSITRNQRSKGLWACWKQHERSQVNYIFSRDADYNVWSTGMLWMALSIVVEGFYFLKEKGCFNYFMIYVLPWLMAHTIWQ